MYFQPRMQPLPITGRHFKKNQFELYTDGSKSTEVHPSYEFQDPEHLKCLFNNHPSWPFLNQIVQCGMKHPLLPISEEDRLIRADAMTQRGNHPTMTKEGDTALREFFSSELAKHCLLPIPKKNVRSLPGAEVCAAHGARQETVDHLDRAKLKLSP